MATTITVNDNGTIVGYLPASEIAKEWGVENSTIRVWIKRGKLKSLKIGNEHYIKQNTEKPEPKKRLQKTDLGG